MKSYLICGDYETEIVEWGFEQSDKYPLGGGYGKVVSGRDWTICGENFATLFLLHDNGTALARVFVRVDKVHLTNNSDIKFEWTAVEPVTPIKMPVDWLKQRIDVA